MSNITNLNRDYLIKINVKEATIDVPKMTFWNTDKKTSNIVSVSLVAFFMRQSKS